MALATKGLGKSKDFNFPLCITPALWEQMTDQIPVKCFPLPPGDYFHQLEMVSLSQCLDSLSKALHMQSTAATMLRYM